ncbi:hypothetical protein [Pseudomonas sp. 31 E 6]|jgi:hypothetical protein|nr:hypothetical protein [Pseudomonas sp. 31 E 5]CRM81191.1 hypothetical protein [Pseudomonas sp. 31 E 6]
MRSELGLFETAKQLNGQEPICHCGTYWSSCRMQCRMGRHHAALPRGQTKSELEVDKRIEAALNH